MGLCVPSMNRCGTAGRRFIDGAHRPIRARRLMENREPVLAWHSTLIGDSFSAPGEARQRSADLLPFGSPSFHEPMPGGQDWVV